MTGSGDYASGMSPTPLLDDETIEAIIAGEEVDARFDDLVAFARTVRAIGDQPPPRPSPALDACFASPFGPRRGRRVAAAAAKVAGLSVAAKVGLGTSLAAASVMAAGAGGALPGPASDGVRAGIEAVTPLEFGDPAAPDRPAGAEDPERFGTRVSSDATGESDGTPGVDGGEISDEAPGAANRPDEPGEDRGLDRAGQTPAAPYVPAEPGDAGTSGAAGAAAGEADPPAGDVPGATIPERAGSGAGAAPPSTVPSPPDPPTGAAPADAGSPGGAAG